MGSKSCVRETRTEYIWDSKLNKAIYKALRGTCDTTGKVCKLAEDFRTEHATAVEYIEEYCS